MSWANRIITSSDLEEKIKELDQEIEDVRLQLLQQYNIQKSNLYSDSSSLDVSGQAESSFKCIKREVGEIIRAVEEEPRLSALLADCEKENGMLRAKLRSYQYSVSHLSNLCSVAEFLEEFDISMLSGSYTDAADLLVKSNALMDIIKNTKGNKMEKDVIDSDSIQALCRILQQRRATMERCLRECLSTAVRFELGQIQISSKLGIGVPRGRMNGEALILSNILEALQRLDLIQDWIDMFAQDVHKFIFDPLFHVSGSSKLSISSEGDRTLLKFDCLEYSKDKTSTKKLDNKEIVALLENILLVLNFIMDQFSKGNLRHTLLVKLMGDGNDGLWSKLGECLERSLPDKVEDLPNFSKLYPFCNDFEARVGSWMELDEVSKKSLSSYVSDSIRHFTSKRRLKILCEARTIMLGDYHNSSHVGDDNTKPGNEGMSSVKKDKNDMSLESRLFTFERCQVTQVSIQVLRKVHETMIETCKCAAFLPDSIEIPSDLFRTGRDIVELFRAVIPGVHGEQIKRIPRLSALFHNDCAYLAYSIATIGHQYRNKLPKPIQERAVFADLIPLLRELGENHLRMQMELQREQLSEFFAGVDFIGRSRISAMNTQKSIKSDTIQNSKSDFDEEESELAVRRVVYHIKQLAQAWREILPSKIYCKVMGNLFEIPLQAILQQILEQVEIPEDKTVYLHRLLTSLLNIYSVAGIGNDTICDANLDARALRMHSRLIAIRLLVDCNLQEISEGLSSGLYRYLNRDELRNLITAIFRESDARTVVLDAIEWM